MAKTSRHSAKEKFAILEEARKSGNIEEVCRQHQISKSLFYKWEKQVKDAALEALSNQTSKATIRKEERIAKEQEAELQHKNEVIAELSAALIAEKKSNGSSLYKNAFQGSKK